MAASHFVFAVSFFLFHMSIEIANEVTRSTRLYLKMRSLQQPDNGCFTLRVRSFGFFVSHVYRNRERSDAIHFTSSGMWTASHFVFAVSRFYFHFVRSGQAMLFESQAVDLIASYKKAALSDGFFFKKGLLISATS